MLVLSRCLNETVTIHCPDGSKIKIVVLNLLGMPKCQLGFDAPDEYQIVRDNAKWTHAPLRREIKRLTDDRKRR